MKALDVELARGLAIAEHEASSDGARKFSLKRPRTLEGCFMGMMASDSSEEDACIDELIEEELEDEFRAEPQYGAGKGKGQGEEFAGKDNPMTR